MSITNISHLYKNSSLGKVQSISQKNSSSALCNSATEMKPSHPCQNTFDDALTDFLLTIILLRTIIMVRKKAISPNRRITSLQDKTSQVGTDDNR
jgi:hypothetical protein